LVAEIQVRGEDEGGVTMAWRKSPPALVALFEATVPAAHDVDRRKMFGYPAAFANGYLFAGLHQESFILKLDEADRAKLHKDFGVAPFEPMPGRKMGEFVSLTDAIVADAPTRARWVKRAHTYAMSLPPKAGKSPQRRAPSSPGARAIKPARRP
jgi:TfoX/Sxy family transcriptional regulator of competence genes